MEFFARLARVQWYALWTAPDSLKDYLLLPRRSHACYDNQNELAILKVISFFPIHKVLLTSYLKGFCRLLVDFTTGYTLASACPVRPCLYLIFTRPDNSVGHR